MKTALITGITGMDGSHLAELLLDKGYEIHGIIRRASTFNRNRIEHLRNYENPAKDNPLLHYGDMTDSTNLSRLIREIQPDEIYHLAAQTFVTASFEVPEYTADVDGLGTLRLLEASREVDDIKFYNASTSELFGKAEEFPQNEKTPFHPRSPYGVAKLYSHWIVCNYREAYGLFACNGILFNHESNRRGAEFVTRKITLAIARIVAGKQKKIYLGNLNAKRDWGYAPEYVKAMWMMLQQKKPEDYVIATGKTHSIREFVELAFAEIDIPIIWKGDGVDEKGIDENTGKILVEVSPELFRPAEVDCLCGDASKARKQLGWKPKVTFEELVKLMVQSDLNVKKVAHRIY